VVVTGFPSVVVTTPNPDPGLGDDGVPRIPPGPSSPYIVGLIPLVIAIAAASAGVVIALTFPLGPPNCAGGGAGGGGGGATELLLLGPPLEEESP